MKEDPVYTKKFWFFMVYTGETELGYAEWVAQENRRDEKLDPPRREALKSLNASFFLIFEDEFTKQVYPRVKEWIEGGMAKPSNIAFTAGLTRVVAGLCEDAVRTQTRWSLPPRPDTEAHKPRTINVRGPQKEDR